MSIFKAYRYYSKAEIEQKAYEVLEMMKAENFTPKWPFDASCTADALGIMIDWQSILPDDKGEIVAKIIPTKQPKIVLNRNIHKLEEEGFQASTIAHEIGHWILHINQDVARGSVQQLELTLSIDSIEQQFLCRNVSEQIYKSHPETQDDWREWQAQYFASCLLMPREILEAKRKGRDLTNWHHLYAMQKDIGVTISNLVYRLQDLGWINIPKGSKQIYPGKAAPNGQTNLFNR
ncbi:MAG: ImmA/IrrE family metallo-endopeptidase [Nostoc sp. JL31]|uniref:ImmA/IrrE family metallo-endopeptidase n=1 Tax=Nostoc sp. JL31 TaxID=2815395 RepID=UPI0025E0BD2B|nr:ImmA/IrrE family metallo-endopeptidase [Nostoc sp. JL31]MBN3892839.1 ImmA/IrrE family metallo-endopeptidase [Nostoc sp. JL31]